MRWSSSTKKPGLFYQQDQDISSLQHEHPITSQGLSMHFGHHHLWAFWFPALPQVPSSARLHPRSSSALCHPSPRTSGTCSGLFLPSPQHPQPPSSTAAIPEHARPRRGGRAADAWPFRYPSLPSPRAAGGSLSWPRVGEGPWLQGEIPTALLEKVFFTSPRPQPHHVPVENPQHYRPWLLFLQKEISFTAVGIYFQKKQVTWGYSVVCK